MTATERQLKNLKPFKKGADPRRNNSGRPRSFDVFRDICRKVAAEKVTARIGGRTVEITRAEAIARQWASSKNPATQQNFIIAAFGKIPDEILINPESTVTLKVKYVGRANGNNGNGSK